MKKNLNTKFIILTISFALATVLFLGVNEINSIEKVRFNFLIHFLAC